MARVPFKRMICVPSGNSSSCGAGFAPADRNTTATEAAARRKIFWVGRRARDSMRRNLGARQPEVKSNRGGGGGYPRRRSYEDATPAGWAGLRRSYFLDETGSNSERKLTAESPAIPIIQNTIPDEPPHTNTPSTGTVPKGERCSGNVGKNAYSNTVGSEQAVPPTTYMYHSRTPWRSKYATRGIPNSTVEL